MITYFGDELNNYNTPKELILFPYNSILLCTLLKIMFCIKINAAQKAKPYRRRETKHLITIYIRLKLYHNKISKFLTGLIHLLLSLTICNNCHIGVNWIIDGNGISRYCLWKDSMSLLFLRKNLIDEKEPLSNVKFETDEMGNTTFTQLNYLAYSRWYRNWKLFL